MNLFFGAKIKETKDTKGIWLNTITLKDFAGNIITLDRNCTVWRHYDDKTGVKWYNVYIWDGEHKNYDITPDMLKGYRLVDYEIEDDAEEGYEVIIDTNSFCILE